MIDLLPCPFCGSDADRAIDDETGETSCMATCSNSNCFASHQWFVDVKWNTRPTEAALQKRVEELEAALRMSIAQELQFADDEKSCGELSADQCNERYLNLKKRVEELEKKVKRVEEMADNYESTAKDLENKCRCHNCYDCAAQFRLEEIAGDIRDALKGGGSAQ